MAMALRILAGGFAVDLVSIYGVEELTVRQCLNDVVDAINDTTPAVRGLFAKSILKACREEAEVREALRGRCSHGPRSHGGMHQMRPGVFCFQGLGGAIRRAVVSGRMGLHARDSKSNPVRYSAGLGNRTSQRTRERRPRPVSRHVRLLEVSLRAMERCKLSQPRK